MFTQSVRLYDLIYSWKDYDAEAARLHALIGRDGGSLLDVACGTGKHLQSLARWYRVEGIDVDATMVELARSRGLDVRQGDMSTFDLGRSFDAVSCLFSSVGYAADLGATVANLARHVGPGGVLAIEPWLTPDTVEVGHAALMCAESAEVRVARANTLTVKGNRTVLDFHYLTAAEGRVDHFTERHDLGLWAREEYASALTRAGCRASYDAEGLMGRGLWIGTK